MTWNLGIILFFTKSIGHKSHKHHKKWLHEPHSTLTVLGIGLKQTVNCIKTYHRGNSLKFPWFWATSSDIWNTMLPTDIGTSEDQLRTPPKNCYRWCSKTILQFSAWCQKTIDCMKVMTGMKTGHMATALQVKALERRCWFRGYGFQFGCSSTFVEAIPTICNRTDVDIGWFDLKNTGPEWSSSGNSLKFPRFWTTSSDIWNTMLPTDIREMS